MVQSLACSRVYCMTQMVSKQNSKNLWNLSRWKLLLWWAELAFTLAEWPGNPVGISALLTRWNSPTLFQPYWFPCPHFALQYSASHHLFIHKHLMSTVFVPGNVSEMQSWVDKKFSPEPGGGDRHANRLYNHVKRASTVVHEAKVREGADPLPEGTRSGLSEDVAMLPALSDGSCLQGSTGKCTHSYDTKQCWEPPLEI